MKKREVPGKRSSQIRHGRDGGITRAGVQDHTKQYGKVSTGNSRQHIRNSGGQLDGSVGSAHIQAKDLV